MWTGVDLNTPLDRGVLYRVRMTFAGKDVKVIGERSGQYVTKWNSIYKGRFDARSCKIVAGLIELVGYGVAPETCNALGFVKFWAIHQHVEGISWYDLALELPAGGGGGGGPVVPPGTPGPVIGTPGYGTPPAGAAPPAGMSPLVVGLVAVLVVALLVGGVWAVKGKGRQSHNCGSPSECAKEAAAAEAP